MTISRIRIAAAQPYEVLVGNGIINELGALLADRLGAHRYAVITDTTVAPSHARRVADRIAATAPCSVFSFPAGEAGKTRETWIDLTDRMLADGYGRDCAVVAVGGGVVGDVAGFVAATFMRGVPLVHVPTTLVAMVDSSIGGKTGVDTPAGKNLVGAFHQPRLVVSDLDTLATLPPDQVRNGMVEALKHGAIADPGYFEQVVSASEHLTGLSEIVVRSVQIKGAIVAEDELEGGKRAILNFGHTVGHAFERATDFSLQHGAAVALGMVVEAKLGRAMGLCSDNTPERIARAVETLGLPTTSDPPIPPETVWSLMGFDKKNRDGAIRCSLLEQIGTPVRTSDGAWTHEVSEAVFKRCLDR